MSSHINIKSTIIGILCVSSLVLPFHQAQAMGLNPVYRNKVTAREDTLQNNINTKAIESDLNVYLQDAPLQYKQTGLYKVFNTNYWNRDFPSIDRSQNSNVSAFQQMTAGSVFSTGSQTQSSTGTQSLGDNSTNEVDFTQSKTTLPANMYMPLSILMQEYYTLFSDAKSFSETDPIPNETSIADTIDSDTMYNYFDLITAADSVVKNPHFSVTERNKHLQGIANDLQESTDMLYQGDAADNQASDVTQNYDGQITAFGDGDARPIYLSHDGYSYAQLVATYRKTPEIKSILKFEASLLDTMYSELQYVQELQAGDNPSSFDSKKYTERINSAYQGLNKGLFKSAQAHVQSLIHDASELTKAQQWQSTYLGKAGINAKPSDTTEQDNLNNDGSDSGSGN